MYSPHCVCTCVRVCARVTSCRPFEEFSSPTGGREGNAHSRSSVSSTPWDLTVGGLFPLTRSHTGIYFRARSSSRCNLGDRSRNADIMRSRCVDPRCGGLGVFALEIDNAPTTIRQVREIDPRTIQGGRVCRCTRDPRRGRGKKGRDRTTGRTVRGVHARTSSGMPLASEILLSLSLSLSSGLK